MAFLATTDMILQVIAALVIFVVGYLVLLLSVIAGLIIANLIYRGARFLWSRMKARAASTDVVSAKIAGLAHTVLCQVEIIRSHIVPARRTGA